MTPHHTPPDISSPHPSRRFRLTDRAVLAMGQGLGAQLGGGHHTSSSLASHSLAIGMSMGETLGDQHTDTNKHIDTCIHTRDVLSNTSPCFFPVSCHHSPFLSFSRSLYCSLSLPGMGSIGLSCMSVAGGGGMGGGLPVVVSQASSSIGPGLASGGMSLDGGMGGLLGEYDEFMQFSFQSASLDILDR